MYQLDVEPNKILMIRNLFCMIQLLIVREISYFHDFVTNKYILCTISKLFLKIETTQPSFLVFFIVLFNFCSFTTVWILPLPF